MYLSAKDVFFNIVNRVIRPLSMGARIGISMVFILVAFVCFGIAVKNKKNSVGLKVGFVLLTIISAIIGILFLTV